MAHTTAVPGPPAAAPAPSGTASTFPAVDCPCCGHVLDIPSGLREGARFACAHCGLMLRNNPAARRFRWSEQDPYVRRHGASRGNLWGGLVGALAWIPALMLVLFLHGKFDLGLVAVLTFPYLGLLAVLRAWRARTPALRWMMCVWAGLGAYLLYLWVLSTFLPGWVGGALLGTAGSGSLTLLALGASWTAIGLGGVLGYARRSRSLPQAYGRPPAD